jgi:hypothetical protein
MKFVLAKNARFCRGHVKQAERVGVGVIRRDWFSKVFP